MPVFVNAVVSVAVVAVGVSAASVEVGLLIFDIVVRCGRGIELGHVAVFVAVGRRRGREGVNVSVRWLAWRWGLYGCLRGRMKEAITS